MKTTFVLTALLSVQAFAAINNSIEIFATQFSWTAETDKQDQEIDKLIKKTKTETAAYDPDCFYSKKSPCPAAAIPLTKELDAKAADYKAETDGAFDISVKKDQKTYRDYGGMAQGYVIDQMKKQLKGKYLLNFSGDIYVSDDFDGAPQLGIGFPGMDNITFAKVVMKSGWMLGTSAPEFGSKVRTPEKIGSKNENKKYEFRKIVLFAKDSFEGGRLDAWSKAFMVGGKKLLNKMEANEAYKGQWAYLYIDLQGKTVCSTNIYCNIGEEYKNNYVKVVWK